MFIVTHYNKSISYTLLRYLFYEICQTERPITLILSIKPETYSEFLKDLTNFIIPNKNIFLVVVENLKEFRSMSRELKDTIISVGYLISTSADRVTLYSPGQHKDVFDVEEKDYATTNGAGDSFLSYFSQGLHQGNDIYKSIEFAIQETYKYLDDYNNKHIG
jgi:sugar/nucleoside kinase (ribokinase family)